MTSNMATSSPFGSRPRMRRMSSSSESVSTASRYGSLRVDLADQIEQLRQGVQVALGRQPAAQGGDTAVAVEAQASLDHLGRAQQVGALADLPGDARRGLVTLAIEP